MKKIKKYYAYSVNVHLFGGVLSSCGTSEKAVDFQNMDSKTF